MPGPPNSFGGAEGDILILSSLLTIICEPAFQEFKGKVIIFAHTHAISSASISSAPFFSFYGRNIYFLFQPGSTGDEFSQFSFLWKYLTLNFKSILLLIEF